jgi:hypothetical protein
VPRAARSAATVDARPRSIRWARIAGPTPVSSTLAGATSQWTRPAAWIAASAPAMSTAIAHAVAASTGAAAASARPRITSVVKYGVPAATGPTASSRTPMSKTRGRAGWARAASRAHSRTIVARAVAGTAFSATSRPRS